MKTSLVQTLSRYTVCLFLLAVSVLPAFGQQPKPNLNIEMKVEPGTEPPVEPEVKPEYKVDYARRHTLELSYGTSKNLKTYHHLMDKGITQAGASKVGLDGLLRYSFFASRHWGAFVQVENSLFWVDELEMNPAAKKYYRERNSEFYNLHYCDDKDKTGSKYNPGSHTALLGAVYRYDVGPFSFRGRLGAGWRLQNTEVVNYIAVVGKGTYYTPAPMEDIYFYTCDKNGKPDRWNSAFAYNASPQGCITPGRFTFFSLELSWTGMAGHMYQMTEVREYGQSFDDPTCTVISKQRERISFGNFLNLRLGIGWNIGRNRNE